MQQQQLESRTIVTQKIIKDAGFVMMIQDAFEHENLLDFKDSLERNLSAKHDEIMKYCHTNHELMIKNFMHYYQVRSQIQDFHKRMDSFQLKLEKTRRSNQYDTKDMNRRRLQIINVVNVQRMIAKIKVDTQSQQKVAISLAQKSIQSTQQDKMTSSIRNVDKVKSHSILTTSNHLTSIQNLLMQIPPLIYKRVQSEADTKISRWIQYSKQKQQEIGISVLQQCEMLLRAAPAQGRMSMIGGGERQSIYFDRPSVLGNAAPNRASMGGGRMMNSIFQNNRMSSAMPNRLSSVIGGNERTSTKRISHNRNSLNRQPESKDALVQDFKVDYSSLKQPQFIYETMKQKQLFISQLKTQRQRLIFQLCETSDNNTSLYEFHLYLANIIGFFVVDKGMVKVIRDYDQSNQLLIDSFKIVEKQIRLIYQRLPPEDLLALKQDLMLFSTAFGKMGMPSIQHSTNKMLSDQFVVFCKRRTIPIKTILTKKISQDGFQNIKTTIREDYEQYVKILELVKTEESEDHLHLYGNNNSKTYELPFSLVVQETVNQVNIFIEYCIQYLSGLNDFDEGVVSNLDFLYQEICDVVKQFIHQCSAEKDPLQLCQLAVNIGCLETSIRFYRKMIENYLQISSTREFLAQTSFREIKYLCEEAIMSQLNLKVQQQLSQLALVNWEPQVPNKGPHDFFEMLVSYLESIFYTISFILPQFVESSIYLTFKFANQQIWRIMTDQVRTFNILGLVNLNHDILCLTKLCNTVFLKHSSTYKYLRLLELMDCLKEIREFLELFLAEHPDDFLDTKKRQQKYSHLSGQKLLLVFPKYKKIKYGKYPIVRKRELKNIIKKIHENPELK